MFKENKHSIFFVKWQDFLWTLLGLKQQQRKFSVPCSALRGEKIGKKCVAWIGHATDEKNHNFENSLQCTKFFDNEANAQFLLLEM